MNTFVKTLVAGTAPAFVLAGTFQVDTSTADGRPLNEPASQPSTQPSAQANPTPPVRPPISIAGERG